VNASIDQCEVLLSGLPSALNLSTSEFTEKLIHAIEVPNILPHVIGVRKWKPSCVTRSSFQSPVSQSSASKATASGQSRAIFIKLLLPFTHDQLISNSHRIGSLTD